MLARIKEQDADAFATLYYRYAKVLLNIAEKRLSNRSQATDIVQDVFIEFYNHRDSITVINIEGYLRTAVKNKVLNALRDAYRREQHHKTIRLSLYDNYKMSSNYLALERELDHAIKQLPDKCREAFVLSRYENLSYKEIAQRMQLSEKTVEMHISRALRKLRELLRDTLEMESHLWIPVALLLTGILK